MTGRVVSLLPAATEIVWALGAGDRLVGVSHECDYPAAVRGLPRVTRTSLATAGSSAAIDAAVSQAARNGVPAITVDRAMLRALRPDLVIGQAVCDVCAVGTAEISEAMNDVEEQRRGEASRDGGSNAPTVITLHAHTLSGVFDDIRRVGEALDLVDRADELIAGLQSRLKRLAAPGRSRPRVLVLEWLDPPYVAGHWVPELVAAAGGEDVAARPGTKSMPRPWQELRALAPDLVVVAPCGFDVPRARRELSLVSDPDARALFAGRLGFVDGNAYTSRPGPRLADAAEHLAALIAG
jgi:iron complex transport system substrate-binding protein